jgi:exoribonuclease-2
VIEYEQHGKPSLGFVLGERKSVFQVVNEQSQELSLPPDRIFLLPLQVDISDRSSALARLKALREEASLKRAEIDLPSVWEVLHEERRELLEKEVAELIFGNVGAAELLAARRALTEDAIFFKRKKIGFEARPAEVVEELKKKAEAEELKARERAVFSEEVLTRLKSPKSFPRNWSSFGISDLENLAALGSAAPSAKETSEFVDEISERAKLGLTGKPNERAFSLLVKLGHFNSDTDLNLICSGRPVYFPPPVLSELEALKAELNNPLPVSRELFTVTIDGEETRDIDDALSIEELPEGYRIGVHISDVSRVVPLGSKLEEHALRRATSVYTPDYMIPMFPPELSESALSLVAGEVRPVMSFYLDTDRQFEIKHTTVSRETLRISRRMSYDEVDRMLTEEEIAQDGLSQLLFRLWDAASAFESRRIMAGALQFPRRELIPIVDENRQVSLRTLDEETPARKLVAELMVAANFVAARYGREHGLALAYRSQEPPEVDILNSGFDIPEGPAREYYRRGLMSRSFTSVEPKPHAGLGLSAYIQITSPIRRALDLLNQRQISAHLVSGRPLFSAEEFKEQIQNCEARLDEANFIQRQRTRYWLLRYLEQQGQKEIFGTIVRVERERPLVELDGIQSIYPFQPAKNVGDFSRKDESRLGERVRLRVQRLNARDDRLQLVEEV